MKIFTKNLAASGKEQTRSNSIEIRLSRSAVIGLIALLIADFALLVWVGTRLWFSTLDAESVRTTPGPSLEANMVHSRPGPWGDLEFAKIAIERPDQYISFNFSTNKPARWFFQNFSPLQLANLFHAAHLNEAQLTALLDASKWVLATNGIYVTPGRDLILGMTPQARQHIYSVLAESPENYYQHFAYSFRGDGVDEEFRQSGLSRETLNLIRALLYPRGSALCFSDALEVYSTLSAPQEKLRLLKTLSRQSTLLMKLRIKPDSDVNPLLAYWGKGGTAKDIKPLLESLTNIPGGAEIDVVHLMPPFARMRLYTYPFPSDDPLAAHQDCFWTAMNFFNEEPDDRFCDFGYTKKVMHADYYPIQDDPAYGDIIWLIDAHGIAIHAAVYIADDVVFTKNGSNFNQPWILMEFKDLLAAYPSDKPIRVVTYRFKRT